MATVCDYCKGIRECVDFKYVGDTDGDDSIWLCEECYEECDVCKLCGDVSRVEYDLKYTVTVGRICERCNAEIDEGY